MTRLKSSPATPVAVSVARQAIFDQERRLWGYELFCVGNSNSSMSGLPLDQDVAVSIASSIGVGLKQITARKKRVVVNLNEKSVLDNQVYILPPDRTTVQVSEQVFRGARIAEHITQLKADGFQIAVPDFTGATECQALYELADVIGTDVRQTSPAEKLTLIAAAKDLRVIPMAGLVDNASQFAACQEQGFELFQGAFSKAPEIVPLRKLSSSQVTRFQLLQVMEAKDPDMAVLAAKIQSDAAISFRLLAYLNSASFCFNQKITSIGHAVSMLGWHKIKNWLRVVLLSDMNQKEDSSELLVTSAQRAKFLELIAIKYPFWGFEPESMHMLGLFSLLDAMLGMPMTEIVTYLPMAGKLKGALCREDNNEYLPLLTLAQNFEEARWDEVQALGQRLNLDEAGTKEAFQEAVDWAAELGVMVAGT